MLIGAVWGPAVALFILRAGRGRQLTKNAALAGLCLGLAWLSGHHEIPIYLTFAAAAMWGWALARSTARGPLAGAAALMFVTGALVSGLQPVPGVEHGLDAQR